MFLYIKKIASCISKIAFKVPFSEYVLQL